MRCINQETLFNYIRQELPPSIMAGISDHLSACLHCREQVESLENLIGRVRGCIDVLNPDTIPSQPSLRDAGGRPRERGVLHRGHLFRPHFSVASAWQLAAILVFVISAAITSIHYLHQAGHPDEVTAALPATALMWSDDPQRDWDEKSVIIQITDLRNHTTEVIRTSLIEKNITRETFPEVMTESHRSDSY